jgi:uncharacterized glyoxalase superfamily protein PhnB
MSTRTSESDNKVKPIPENYPPLTPYLCCKNAGAAIEFYKNAFGAREEESMRMTQLLMERLHTASSGSAMHFSCSLTNLHK